MAPGRNIKDIRASTKNSLKGFTRKKHDSGLHWDNIERKPLLEIISGNGFEKIRGLHANEIPAHYMIKPLNRQ